MRRAALGYYVAGDEAGGGESCVLAFLETSLIFTRVTLCKQIFGIGEGETLTVYERKQFEVEYKEVVLQNWLGANPDWILEDEKMLVVSREVRTDLGGFIDLLGLDREGNVVVVELKRDDTPRDVIAQAVEYAAWAEDLVEDELEKCLRSFKGDDALSLAKWHARYFGLGDARAVEFNRSHRIVIVGQDVTNKIRRSAAYLRDKGIRLTCREFTLFQSDGGDRLLHLATVVPKGRAPNRSPSRELTEIEQLILRFWAGLLKHAKLKTQLHAICKSTTSNFVGARARMPIKGLTVTFYYWVRAHDADVVLYIDGQEAEHVFKALNRKKEEIEERFGSELDWDPKEKRRHCRIQKTYDGGYQDEDSWGKVFEVLASAMASLESALKPHLDSRLLFS